MSKNILPLFFLRWGLFLTVPLLAGCAGVQKWLDISGMDQKARQILKEPVSGTPASLRAFMDTFNLELATRPPRIIAAKVKPLDHWLLPDSKKGAVITELVQFPSALPQEGGVDTAFYYLYRTGPLQGGKTILWVPGMGVSNLAFRFTRRFFQAALDRGYAVVVYIPPFHLERRVPGRENGEGFFTADPLSNIKVILTMVRELRSIHDRLTRQGVASFGGWGGSMGASALLLFASLQPIHHACVMIPVLDWPAVVCHNPHFEPVISKLKADGYDADLLRRAYGLISPVNYAAQVQPDHIQILYAREDQLTPEAVTLEYARDKGITNITGYARSHATILLTPSLYRDYNHFLDSLPD